MNRALVIYEENTDMLTIEDIIAATGGKAIYSNSNAFTGVSIDSRTIREGELFIALKGSRFDGHNFLNEALDKGSGALVNFPPVEPVKGKTIIYVDDTLKALQGIARYLRLRRDIPVIGITGSNGKTTTKELIASILGTKYRVLKNIANLNNHIGLPLSLTRINDTDEVVVLEMGASGPGEIKDLCEIAVPNYGVLTNISQAHLEGFKDLETIRKTKLELLDYISAAVVNADDPFMTEGIRTDRFKGRLVRYGIKNSAEIHATDIRLYEKGSIFNLHIGENGSIEVHPKISGMFNIYNLLAAASVGYLFNIGLLNIKNAIDSFTGLPMRLEFTELNGVKIINDVYNANPASMEEAIKELVRVKKGRIIAVLGDMLELGSHGEEAHRRLGRLMSGFPIDIFIAVGPLMSFAASEFNESVYKLQSAVEAGKLLRDICKKGDTVLIKGSRGMNMERVLADGP
ncbi:MAG: UDP-N-acetylmuramoyl-tripeptide--D-alanyl-D-alanine ligase [Nitrospirae bacterium CG_4_10_14_0_8_um_filter_41_23]|nr:UDP-N-acetylmuramoyl-tripeptide--D-alanyl-D-alanine ligase [Nitrospirota bacterium]PIQ95085.1 MAG: UDP-N-acetylmuramoylalanyl-D-glutamyl-2, 6-diaminopimelate--D-alanyl-D-alanine ligase [Nitrospirae bacterium CG11_big_fil_rev_8_21_14_0_20_41_14]PIV41645.1 MAG: UDP-N-acetylmuramoyl-tripeptide--D-alanyl-D-alanine ligase [Nitrospirae bacterium CG02_land_8_20_14_3_00_41_53]PIW86693.1 MAG: UDP-N-acetylmuramoyl-tripeptide--D-alanyl-D-alanine ligase [Nitrospirae bacterium CG_4_8_14_3_um_filter_41_47]